MTTYVPVLPAPPQRSRWWWLRYWQVVAWLGSVVAGVAAWRAGTPEAPWVHTLTVTATFAYLAGAAVTSR